MIKHITKGSIFDDLGFDKATAENLKIRAALMQAIKKYIDEKRLTQGSAAKRMGVSQPRISDLVCGKIDRFTIDMLVNMLTKAHISILLLVDDKRAA